MGGCTPLVALPQYSGPTVPISNSLFPLFSYPCGLFCTHPNHNSFILKRFHTLYAKHPGGGDIVLTNHPSSEFAQCLHAKLPFTGHVTRVTSHESLVTSHAAGKCGTLCRTNLPSGFKRGQRTLPPTPAKPTPYARPCARPLCFRSSL